MTKLWIVSDTHRHYAPVLDYLKNDPHDVVLHLGDHAADAQEMAYYLHVPVIAVRGNCDGADGEIPLERILEYHGLRIFMTHGHGYRVKSDRRYLAAKAKKENCPLALYGHTHVFSDEEVDGVRLINPGALYLPRGGRPTAVSLTVQKDGRFQVDGRYL